VEDVNEIVVLKPEVCAHCQMPFSGDDPAPWRHQVIEIPPIRPMSVGTVSQLEQATTVALAAPVEEARTFVHAQAAAHLDETSWWQGNQRAWLWVAVTSWVTVFLVRLSRGGQVARELLGERFAGIVVTDRYND
jgi:hypothetical protein